MRFGDRLEGGIRAPLTRYPKSNTRNLESIAWNQESIQDYLGFPYLRRNRERAEESSTSWFVLKTENEFKLC